MSETKLVEELFVLFMFGHFSGREGWLPNSKLVEELFCLSFEGGGGLPDSKGLRNLFACVWTWGVNLIRKMRRIFFFLWSPINKEGVQARLNKNVKETDFLGWLP